MPWKRPGRAGPLLLQNRKLSGRSRKAMIYSPRPDGGPAAQASPSMPPHSPSICCPGDRNASAPVPGTAGRRAVTSPETQRRPPTGLRGYASLRLIRSASGRFESPGQTDRLLILNWGKLKSARSADPATLRDPSRPCRRPSEPTLGDDGSADSASRESLSLR